MGVIKMGVALILHPNPSNPNPNPNPNPPFGETFLPVREFLTKYCVPIHRKIISLTNPVCASPLGGRGSLISKINHKV